MAANATTKLESRETRPWYAPSVSLKRVLLLLLALAGVGVFGLVLLATVLLPRWIRAEVIASASARGIDLVPGEISFGLGWVQVTDSRATLVGVRGLELSIGLMDVTLAGMTPERVNVGQVRVRAVADPVVLFRDASNWYRAHAPALAEPTTIHPLEVELRQDAKSAPLLRLEKAALDYRPPGFALRAERATVMGRDLGAARAALTERALELGATLGSGVIENPTLLAELTQTPKPSLHLALSATPIAQLASTFQLALPLPNVTLAGSLDATFPPEGFVVGKIEGEANFSLTGYVPPHPPELDGFVFGDVTRVASRFVVEPAALRIRLEQTSLAAGAFALRGDGELGMSVRGPRLKLTLVGALPCAALVGAAAETRLGAALGPLSGKAARTSLAGAVSIRVLVDADLSNLEQARALKTITPGCGLKLLSLSELRALGELLPEALDPAVAADFQALLKQPLPKLPTFDADTRLNLPKLPELPLKLPLPLGSARLAGSAAAPVAAPKSSAP